MGEAAWEVEEEFFWQDGGHNLVLYRTSAEISVHNSGQMLKEE